MILGGDFLAGHKYRKAMMKAQRPGDCGGIFLRTFGLARKTVIAMAKSGKFSEIVVHLAPFDGSHAYPISKLKKQIIADTKWCENIAVANPNTKILISPFCENRHSREKLQPLFAQLKTLAPSCLFVNATLTGTVVPGVITELHIEDSKHLPKKPIGEYIISFDGCGSKGQGNFPDLDVSSLIERYSDARQIRYWDFAMNLKWGWKDKTPIKDRKEFPSVGYLKTRRAMLKKREGPVTWNNKALYKPCADDHKGPSSKDSKALAILPINTGQVKVFDRDGNVIDVMNRFPGDHEGTPQGARFYSGKYSSEIADKAIANTGSSLGRIHNQPLTDLFLRSGIFR